MKSIALILTTSLWLLTPGLSLYGQDNPLVEEEGSVPALPASNQEPPQSEAEQDMLSTQNLIVTRSADRTEVRGFSAGKGRWENLTLPKSDRFEWDASEDVAVVRAGDNLAAFSADTGHWDVLVLSKDSTAVCTNHGTIATINDGEHFYTFSAKTNQWTSPTDDRLKSMQKELPGIRASDKLLEAFDDWLRSQPRYKSFAINDAGRGVMLYANRQEYFGEAESKLKELMAESQKTANTESQEDPFAADPGSANSGNGDPNSIISRSPSPDELQRMSMRINSLKRDAVHREGMLKVFARGRDLSKPEVMTELREETAVAFDKRQEWYEAEAKRLEMRLERIQFEIAQRKSTREKIIERQIQQLTTLERVPSESSSDQPDDLDIIHNEVPPTPADNELNGNPKRAAMPESMVSASPIDLARALRQAKTQVESLKEESKRAEEFIARYSQPLEVLKNDVLEKGGVVSAGFTQEFVDNQRKQAEASLKGTKEQLRVAQKDWQLLWEEYQSHVRILASEVETVKAQLVRGETELKDLHHAAKQGLIPKSELLRAEAFAEVIKQGLIRVQERLSLFALVKEQQPELQPPAEQTTTTPTENVKPDDPFAR